MPDDSRVLDLPMTAAYFRLILRRFGASPRRRAALLTGTGVASDGDEIPVRAQLQQLANLQGVAAPGWGLELGGALDGVAHGPAGAMIVSAPTLRDALTVLARYATVRTPFIDLRTRAARVAYEVRVVETCDLGSARAAVLEMVLLSTQWVVESALGRPMREARFTMPAPPPAYADRYAAAFHAPVAFDGDAAVVSIPTAWLPLPCPLADRATHRSAGARLEALRQRLTGDFVDAHIEMLLAAGDDAGTSLAPMAARLRVSPRTLVRRLQGRATSYRSLRDAHRRRRAAELLRQPSLSVAEIAERLGYQDPTNFGRACRRWFGCSPRAYRAHHR